jgi:hypothetical protein
MSLTQTIRTAIEQDKHGNTHPIDFDHVWRELGYVQRNRAGRQIIFNLSAGDDYILLVDTDATKGRKGRKAPLNRITLTLKGFEKLARLTKTDRGRQALANFTELQAELRRAYIDALERAYGL